MKLAQGGPDATCSAYCLFYIKEGSSLIENKKETIKQLLNLTPKNIIAEVESENKKFDIEYHHYLSNIIQKVYNDDISTMSTISFEATKFLTDLKNLGSSALPILTNFNIFLLLETPKCTEIARWHILSDVLKNYDIPYKILEGDKNNFYYEDLKQLIVDNVSTYGLKSLELSESNQKLLIAKKQEYIGLIKCGALIKHIIELIHKKMWKESLISITILHENLKELKAINLHFSQINYYQKSETANCFISFGGYLLSLIALRFCAIFDMLILKNSVKDVNKIKLDLNFQFLYQALDILQILVYSLNKKQSLKLSKGLMNQIITNLTYTVNNAKKSLQEDYAFFTHLIKRLDQKNEFLPSFDINFFISQVK